MATTKSKEFKLDIFKFLTQLNSGDLHIWETLNEEQRNSVSAYVVSQWMYGTNNDMQIILNNELVNPFIWSFSKRHPEILVKLLACVGDGSRSRFKWIPMPKAKKDNRLRIQVIMEYYDYSEREAISNNHLLSNEIILQYAEELGWTKEELTKLKKEIK
jgi:hypothetical protein